MDLILMKKTHHCEGRGNVSLKSHLQFLKNHSKSLEKATKTNFLHEKGRKVVVFSSK